jgi:hypothetical protein
MDKEIDMLNLIRTRWSKVSPRLSTGLLLATLFTAGGVTAYQRFTADDCCQPGAPCCHPGSPCCRHAP